MFGTRKPVLVASALCVCGLIAILITRDDPALAQFGPLNDQGSQTTVDPFGSVPADVPNAADSTAPGNETAPNSAPAPDDSADTTQTETTMTSSGPATQDPFGTVPGSAPSTVDPFGTPPGQQPAETTGTVDPFGAPPTDTPSPVERPADNLSPTPSSVLPPGATLNETPYAGNPEPDSNPIPGALRPEYSAPETQPASTTSPLTSPSTSSPTTTPSSTRPSFLPPLNDNPAISLPPKNSSTISPSPFSNPVSPASTFPATSNSSQADSNPPESSMTNSDEPFSFEPNPVRPGSAQSGNASPTIGSVYNQTPSSTRPSRNAGEDGKFARLFWRYLSANNYKNWSPAPNRGDDHFRGEGPHGDWLKIYLNRKAIAASGALPVGSVVVIENYAADKSLESITAMMRSDGFNPPAGDWYWVKYNADGTVVEGPGEGESMLVTGRVDSCIKCHSTARGDDFVFFNDN